MYKNQPIIIVLLYSVLTFFKNNNVFNEQAR